MDNEEPDVKRTRDLLKELTTSGFVTPTQRDAWAAIRGYLYQIRLTVLRWLDLDDQTVLLCEYGEDVELVRIIKDRAAEATIDRLIEQVKYRTRKLTLRSQEVLDALGNFFALSSELPSIHTRLRFTTNATPGRERGFKFSEGRPGIEACIRIAASKADAVETASTLASFRKLIDGASTPGQSSGKVTRFEALRQFVRSASSTELECFLRRIEWEVSQPQSNVLPREIEERLINVGLASPNTAKRVAERLTLVVLDTVARSGLKVLDRAALLTAIRELEFTEVDLRILRTLDQIETAIQSYLPEIAAGVGRLEADVGEIRRATSRTQEMLARAINRNHQPSVVGVDRSIRAPDAPPEVTRNEVYRTSLVSDLTRLLSETSWLHLQGSAGTGKTLLTRSLLLQEPNHRFIWVSFSPSAARASPLQHLDERLLASLVTLSGDNSWWAAFLLGSLSTSGLVSALFRHLRAGAILALDDLPDLIALPELENRLSTLAHACSVTGCHLLTNGHRSLTVAVAKSIPPSSVREFPVPPMNAQDALAMLRTAGAPASLSTEQFAELLVSRVRGHPALMAAAVRWLEQRSWTTDWRTLDGVLAGTAFAEELKDALRRMVSLVPDDMQRELLCRLSLIGWQFGRKEIEIVASVRPRLSRPGEVLDELIGPWISRFGTDRFEVTPLLSEAGRTYLARDLQRQVHAYLARGILANKPVSVSEAFQATIHLSSAEEWRGLSWFLINLMMGVRKPQHAQAIDWVLLFFSSNVWPESVPRGFRLMLRSLQVKIGRLAGKDVAQLDNELENMLSTTDDRPDELLAALMALTTAGPFLEGEPSGRAVWRAIRAGRLIREHPRLFEGQLAFLSNVNDLIWFPIARVRSLDDITDVASAIGNMRSEEITDAFSSELAVQGSEMLADKAWLVMYEKPEVERDWNLVLKVLTELERVALQHDIEKLRCMAAHARAVVLADHLNRADEALRELGEIQQARNADCLFYVRYRVARILDDLGRREDAVKHYEEALATGGDEFVYLRFRAHMEAAVASGRAGDSTKSMIMARRGLAFAGRYRRASFVEFGAS
jgi:hypothetical protein